MNYLPPDLDGRPLLLPPLPLLLSEEREGAGGGEDGLSTGLFSTRAG